MSGPSKQPRLPGVVTLPTLRTARAEWEGALAAVEELEAAVEEKRSDLAATREMLTAAEKELRHRSVILREVMQSNRQEVMEEVRPPDETT